MNRILITGSHGFIGNALKEKCQLLDIPLIKEIKGDISNQDLHLCYQDNIPDHIFHLAAKTFVPRSWEEPLDFYKTNVYGLLNILEFCRKHKISMTFVSAYIYGVQSKLPVSEEAIPVPNNPYANSKLIGEQLCKFYIENYDLNISIIRPFNVYGPNQDKDFIFQKILDQALSISNEIQLDSLLGKRDYVYIDDVVNALIMTIGLETGYLPINIGSGVSHSISDVIKMIFAELGIEKKIVCANKKRKNEILDVVADIARAKEILSWEPYYNMSMGIKDIIQKGNYER